MAVSGQAVRPPLIRHLGARPLRPGTVASGWSSPLACTGGSLAQLARATGFYPVGSGFDPQATHQRRARAYDRRVTEVPEPAVEPGVLGADDPLPDLGGLGVIEAELDDVTRALERLDEGSYGTCEACGTALADELLASTPAARRCAEHAA